MEMFSKSEVVGKAIPILKYLTSVPTFKKQPQVFRQNIFIGLSN